MKIVYLFSIIFSNIVDSKFLYSQQYILDKDENNSYNNYNYTISYDTNKNEILRELIDDEYFENYLTQFFDSVQIQIPYSLYNENDQSSSYTQNYCECNGCMINKVCLTFLREKICNEILGTYCD